MVDLSHTTPFQPLSIRVLTHNIRYFTRHPSQHELPWPQRAPHLLPQLHHHTHLIPTSLICLQEVLHSQLRDIHSSLSQPSSPWDYVGVGRDDGQRAGEYSPIFFRSDVWTRVFQKTIWLSPSPDIPGSKGWDAACVRILTVAVLRHCDTNRDVLVMNTHLDDRGATARREGAKIIVKTARDLLQQFHPCLYFLAGDLNSPVGGEAYQVLNKEGSGFVDVRKLVEQKNVYGDMDTFTGFDGKDGRQRIDFVHVGMKPGGLVPEKMVEVMGYAVLPNRFDDGIYLSDHRAVVADIMVRE